MSGTDIAYEATALHLCYGICGTELAYGAVPAMLYAVLSSRMVLWDVRHAVCGTELAYGATPAMVRCAGVYDSSLLEVSTAMAYAASDCTGIGYSARISPGLDPRP
eukprot:1779698-Rhodomonas_salina.1